MPVMQDGNNLSDVSNEVLRLNPGCLSAAVHRSSNGSLLVSDVNCGLYLQSAACEQHFNGILISLMCCEIYRTVKQ